MKSPRLLSLVTLVFSLLPVTEAVAQVKPDNTLGNENSVVIPIDQDNQRIDGGATRGANLFHSFLEFNVGAGRGVYFANPAGIENILSRITGNRPSRIFGTLGVLGDANLFLLNPNGIFFGQNARLDINGSFLATTADGISLGNQGYFSASEPQTSNLVAVEPGALFFNQVANQPGVIRSQGNLTTGGNFTLWADKLDLKGQLQAGGDLTLQAQDTIRAQDNAANPFIAQAGNQLLVQGDQKVEILAFNHPNSGLFSGGNMTLRSGNRVGGDTRYTSGGNFTIEQLDGSLGDLFSPKDPTVRAGGDVSFNNYTGASLHIFAGGSVTIPGNIRITGTDTADNSIQENVTLSKEIVVDLDGSTQTIVANIDGSTEPTLDIRAGTTAVGAAAITGTGSDITIGNINNEGGLVLLTNQYAPNNALPAGTIQVGNINTRDRMDAGGNIYIDSRGSIQLNSNLNSSAGQMGDAGDIILFADEEIAIANSRIASDSRNGLAGLIEVQASNSVEINASTLTSESLGSDTSGAGGAISITAQTGSIALDNGTRLNTSARGDGFAGFITLDAGKQIAIANNSSIISNADTREAGLIGLQANNDINISNSDIKAESRDGDNLGLGGFINITAKTGSIALNEGAQLSTSATGDGVAGNITLDAGNQIAIANNSEIRSNANNGVAGTINLQANNSVNITNGEIQAQSRGSDTIGGGSIEITANTGSISLNEGARLNTSVTGDGFAGNIHLDAGSEIVLADDSEIRSNANNGIAGFIDLQANNSVEVNNSKLRAESRGADDFGVGGFIKVTAETNSISLDGATVSTTATGSGVAGFINLASGNEIITKDSNIQSNAANGLAGAIDLQADSSVSLTNTKITADSEPVSGGILINGEQGDGGDISINSWSLVMTDSAISSNSRGDGNAGNITLNIVDNLHLDNSEITADSTQAGGGDIDITAYDSRLRNGSLISSSVANGDGGGGDINITSPLFLALEDSDILANANQGAGGNITINSEAFLADLFANGNAVAVGSNPGDFNQFRGNDRVDISASSQVAGLSGQVSFPDFSFLQYSLSQLSANFVNPEQAIAGSCLARRNTQQGSFTVTGTGGLPPTPNNTFSSQYRLRGVQSVGEGNVSQNQVQPTATISNWQIGDPVIEAQGLMATADGRIVLGNEPQLGAMVGVEDVVCE